MNIFLPSAKNAGKAGLDNRLVHYMIGLCMLAAAGFALLLTPHIKLSDRTPPIELENAIPKQFGDWAMDESIVPIRYSPELEAEIQRIYSQSITRTYLNSRGQKIMLYIAYGSDQTGSLRAHKQQYCYEAQGYRVFSLNDEHIQINDVRVPIVQMQTANRYYAEPVTYWFTMGDSIASGSLDRHLIQWKYALSGIIPDGYLFRVSSIGPDTDKAYETQREFVREMINAVSPALKNKMLGTPS